MGKRSKIQRGRGWWRLYSGLDQRENPGGQRRGTGSLFFISFSSYKYLLLRFPGVLLLNVEEWSSLTLSSLEKICRRDSSNVSAMTSSNATFSSFLAQGSKKTSLVLLFKIVFCVLQPGSSAICIFDWSGWTYLPKASHQHGGKIYLNFAEIKIKEGKKDFLTMHYGLSSEENGK